MERIDDLEYKNLKLIQNTDYFCFGIDSVLLTDFAKNIKKNSKIADFGSGNGILSILLSKKLKQPTIYAIEKQIESFDLLYRNILLNNLENQIIPKNEDILNNTLEPNSFDAIISNPPYQKEGSGIQSTNSIKDLARFESSATMDDWIKISSKLLKQNGELYLVYRTDRLIDLFSTMRKYKIEPKTLKFIHSYKNSMSKIILIKGVKCAKPFLNIEEPIIIYNDDNSYTNEILKIYSKEM